MTSEITIITYDPNYQSAFYQLNFKWIDQYFGMENEDQAALADPEAYYLKDGGEIFFALYQGEAVGTVALKALPDKGFELSKMAVDSKARGLGIGGRLIEHAIQHARKLDAAYLMLQTNSTLAHARRLYDAAGFVQEPVPENAKYARADVQMRLSLRASETSFAA